MMNPGGRNAPRGSGASLECGDLAPLCYRSRLIEDQSGARSPHSKEAPEVFAAKT